MKGYWRRLKKAFRYGEKGFTLIELLIVIAVLGALAAVVVPNVGSFLGSANRAAANTEAQNVKTAAMSFLADNGAFPGTSANLTPTYISQDPSGLYTFDTDSTWILTATDQAGSGITDNLNWDCLEQEWITGTLVTCP